MNDGWAREGSEETTILQEVGDTFPLSSPNEWKDDENMWSGNGLVRDLGGLEASNSLAQRGLKDTRQNSDMCSRELNVPLRDDENNLLRNGVGRDVGGSLWADETFGLDASNSPEQKSTNETRQIRDKFFWGFNLPLRDDENSLLRNGVVRDAGGCPSMDEMPGLDALNHMERTGAKDTKKMHSKFSGECEVPLHRERPLLEIGKRTQQSDQGRELQVAQRVRVSKQSDCEGTTKPRNPQSQTPSQNEESSRECCPELRSSVGDERFGRQSGMLLEDQARSRMMVEIRSDTSTSAKHYDYRLPPKQELAHPDENSEAQEQAATRSQESAMENAQRTISIKKRLVWTQDLHERFLRAVNVAGIENAVPKTILEIMDVKGLTTEHVKSHLQKFRNNLRKSKTDASESAGRDSSCMRKICYSPGRLGVSESLGARTMDESKASLNSRQTIEKQWELHENGTQLLLSQQILLRKIAHFHRKNLLTASDRMRGKEEPKSENDGKDQLSGAFLDDFYNLHTELDDLQQQLKRQTDEYERIGKQLHIL
uniref:HTH myb-type domain-containing protein n=1 Tax=Rhodosorus marinus TaxID=101924 RepID=A0A7S0BL66_9RHOD|mmetsp:Transcript_19391/g.28123  ORF Transcript_19391/g.28123 Transcript_19391/m.28123 type:complete len:541 (+) Transcript_19391:298-1920(+)